MTELTERTHAIAPGDGVVFPAVDGRRSTSATGQAIVADAARAADDAHRFGIEIFAPETSRVLMAALLVHDLHVPRRHAHPEGLFSDGAAHGGLWRAAYDPRSVLGLAVVAGLTSRTSDRK